MKKIAFTIIAFLFFITLAGCFSVSEISSIELVEQPKTTYSIGEQMGSFKIKLIYSDGREPLVISSTNSAITVENFSTSTAGTFTAQIKYTSSDYRGAPISFQYTVVDLKEIRGSGTEADPYLISTPDHWNLMDTMGQGKFFRLTNDIDFSGKTIKQFAPNGVFVEGDKQKVFSATIDGANYSLRNINLVSQAKPYKYKEIFGYVQDFTLKNINIIFSSNDFNGATGLIIAGVGDVLFDNVKTYGFIKQATGKDIGNGSVFAAMPGRLAANKFENSENYMNLTFNNCINYTDLLLGGQPEHVGGFVGVIRDTTQEDRKVNLTFNNCSNYGMVEGGTKKTGGFIGWLGNNMTLSVNNCKNYGLIVQPYTCEVAYFAPGYTPTDQEFLNVSPEFIEIPRLEVNTTTKKFTKEEGKTYIIQYAFSGETLDAQSTHIRLSFELVSDSYEHLYLDNTDSAIDPYVKDVSYVSEFANKYVDSETGKFYFTRNGLVHQAWNTNKVTVSIYEYDTVTNKLTKYWSATTPYDAGNPALLGE